MPNLSFSPPLMRRRGPIAWAVVGACAWLAACSTASGPLADSRPGLTIPYRPEVVQGNVVTREQVAALQAGLSREQVREILGSPLLTDAFHANRWDYAFSIRRQGTVAQQHSVVLLFDGDALKTITAPPDLPSEQEFVTSISRKPLPTIERKLELTTAERAALPVPARPEPGAAAGPLGAARAYPPLEPQ